MPEDASQGREDVLGSRTLQDAILRNPQVMCESTQRIDDRYRENHPEIEWKAIAGMRNVPVHDYFEVDFATVWQIVERDLLPLRNTMIDIAKDIAG